VCYGLTIFHKTGYQLRMNWSIAWWRSGLAYGRPLSMTQSTNGEDVSGPVLSKRTALWTSAVTSDYDVANQQFVQLRYKRKAFQAIAVTVSWDFDGTTSWMPKMKKNCLYVCLVHPVFASARRRSAAVSQSVEEENKKGEWESQDPCECANGYRKTEGSSWVTTQHF